MLDSNGKQVADENGKPVYYCGFSIGGGIDQDYTKSPQNYQDHGIYITNIKPDGPAANVDLRVNDKILQVNGIDFTMVTHRAAVEHIKKGKHLKLLVSREETKEADK